MFKNHSWWNNLVSGTPSNDTEARLRNLSDIPLTVDTRLEPEHCMVAYFIQTPAGHTKTYHPAASRAQAVTFADQALATHTASPDMLTNLTIAQVGKTKADNGVHQPVIDELTAFSEKL